MLESRLMTPSTDSSCRWSTQYFSVAHMTPIWIFPAYPLLIIGPHAGQLAARVRTPEKALDIIIGGFIVQGTGFLVSLTVYAAFVYRSNDTKVASRINPARYVRFGRTECIHCFWSHQHGRQCEKSHSCGLHGQWGIDRPNHHGRSELDGFMAMGVSRP